MRKVTIIMVLMVLATTTAFAQNYLSEKKEQSIKLSGNYYWDEGTDFDEAIAYHDALNNLTERIASDVVYQNKKREEVLKELKAKAHFGRIRQEGMVCVLAWIAKDSVFVTAHIPSNPPHTTVVPQPVETHVDPPVVTPRSDSNANEVADDVLQELINCKNYKDVNKSANRHGLVRGDLNSSEGFDRPDLCYIAVFDSSWSLVALLDKGGTTRMDLKSGQMVQNPETYYRNNGCNLWYLQRK